MKGIEPLLRVGGVEVVYEDQVEGGVWISPAFLGGW